MTFWKIKVLRLYLIAVMAALNLQCQRNKHVPGFEILKVDFDFSGRRVKEVNEPHYISWPIEESQNTEKTFDRTTIELRGDFNSGWYKVGVHAPYYAQLVNDGLVAEGNLEMTISGLPEGDHSLLTFHNTFDNPEEKKYSQVNIYVNNKKLKTIVPSNRATSTIQGAMAYFQFEVEEGKETIIRFEADRQAPGSNKELVINGFELDGANMMLQARNPQPKNDNRHVMIEENFKLQWDSPKRTKKRHLYFGESKEAVKDATEENTEYKGEMEGNDFEIKDLYSMTTYYWRVDEVDENDKVTKGEVWSFRPAQLAFPGAEGYGRYALGGRGGKVIEVNNLNDSGPGSLREAVTKDIGPRIIVFNVSGNIELKSRLVVSQPNITIAGQTAPGKGITISRAPLGLTGNDGIIRFLKVRIGAGRTYDGMGLTGANHSIIDHCSISWTIDESFSSRGAHNITLQRTLISEALNVAGHHKYETGKMHGYAATIGGSTGSFHHNLLAHNYGRNWSMGGGLNGDGYYTGKLDIRNNVVYNWGQRTTDGGAREVNFVNNYYKTGPSTKFFYALKAQHEGVGKGKQQYYFEGNVMPGYFDEESQEKGRTIRITNDEIVNYETFVNAPFFKSYVRTQSAKAAYKNVLSNVGANQPFFDQHDNRMIEETLQGSYSYKGSKSGLPGMIDTEEDAGGWPEFLNEQRPPDWDTDHDGLPNWWEDFYRLNPNSGKDDFSDTHSDEDRNGFTEMDEYMDWMSKPHYFIPKGHRLRVKAEELFKGFTDDPKYSVIAGEAALNDRQFKFSSEIGGLHSFKVAVEDADGDTMERTVNVCVK